MIENRDADKGPEIWNEWDARGYLREYFNHISADVRATTAFVMNELKQFEGKQLSRVLDFGSGPTIIGIAGTPPYAREIHIADYLDPNLNEIRMWMNGDPNAFDFNNILALTLEQEGQTPTPELLHQRADELRTKITKIIHCDAGARMPLGLNADQYPLIISLYCADSATSSKNEWNRYMTNILSLLESRGTMIMAALRKCEFYTIGNHRFPSANIDEHDITAMFRANGFSADAIDVNVADVPTESGHGFTSLLFAKASRNV